MKNNVKNIAESGLLAVLVLFFCWQWCGTGWRMIAVYNPFPVQDYWRIPALLPSYQAFDWRVLWQQHNEHRIIFPELVFAADMLLGRGRMLLPLIVSAAVYFATWVIFAGPVLAARGMSTTLRAAAVLLAGLVMGWSGSVDVLGLPFLLQWTLVQACCAGALFLLCRGRLAGVVALGVIATYSSGNGLLLWPLLIGAALLLGVGKRRVMILAVSAAAAIGIYFVGYRFGSSLNIGSMVRHPFYTLGFLCSYLSVPFGLLARPRTGVLIGAVSLVCAGACVLRLRVARALRETPFIVLFGSYLMTIATALLTAAGRMQVDDLHYTAARASRYITMPLATWGALILLVLWTMGRQQANATRAWTVISLLLLLLGYEFLKLEDWVHGANEQFARYQLGTLSVENGLWAPEAVQWIFPDTGFVKSAAQNLAKAHLSIYREDKGRWLGRSLAEFGRVSGTATGGSITYVKPVQGGYEVVGWYFEGRRTPSHRDLVLSNENGLIVGFGSRLPAGFPKVLHTVETPDPLAWVGFVNSRVPAESICAYLITPKKDLILSRVPGSRQLTGAQ